VSVSFTKFAAGLGVKPTAGQAVFCKVAFDGVDPIDLPPKQRELASVIFGDVDRVPEDARGVVGAICGRDVGKSYLFCGGRMLHLGMTVKLDSLARGENAWALFVAPDVRLGRIPLNFAFGLASASPSIAKRIVESSSDHFTIARDGRHVRFQVLPATRGGTSVRGRSLVGAALDEVAYFRDKDFIVNDEAIFNAVTPRILPGGQVVLASSPWAETGLLYELYRDNFGHPDTALVACAATLTMRDDPDTLRLVERERRRNPDNASVEFDANFMTTDTGLFIASTYVDDAVDDTLVCAGGIS
jgi:hypothetical protein